MKYQLNQNYESLENYKTDPIKLSSDAEEYLKSHRFPGNIRQLRNIAEQISVVEENRTITAEKLSQYLPNHSGNLPAVIGGNSDKNDFATERDIMYKVLFDMRNDINDLKKLTMDLMKSGNSEEVQADNRHLIQKIYQEQNEKENSVEVLQIPERAPQNSYDFAETVEEDENLSLQEKEIEMIKKSLEKNNGKRKLAAKELGISERTLYRKIKQYDL